jgi:putative ABC transport system ATP-binding protein
MTGTPVLELVDVRRTFGQGTVAVTAVRDATLEVVAGELVAIMGPSGSGKSTLLSIMGGLLRPDGGEVLLLGQPLRAMSDQVLASLRRTRIGFVFQKFNLLKALTAIENVQVAFHLSGMAPAEARTNSMRALEDVGLGARARSLPRDLSGGEQQRVAVARALAAKPALILADEPTGSLDSTNGRLVVDLVQWHVRRYGAAAVIVTHDHRVRAAVDRQLWMEDGALRDYTHAEAPSRRAV